jgi:RNA polymerase sigma-70 factor (ECF subfamily)
MESERIGHAGVDQLIRSIDPIIQEVSMMPPQASPIRDQATGALPAEPLGLSSRWLREALLAARRVSPSPQATDDLAHDAFLRAVENPPPDRNFGPWIQRICRNLLVDGWRAGARASRLQPADTAPAAAPTGEEAALAGELRRQVRRAVVALPRDQRRAVILRYEADWPFDRIARRLGVEEATARTRVHRALAALRRSLGALRAWFMPGPIAFKPALAVLLALAAEPRALESVRRVIPAAAIDDAGAGRARRHGARPAQVAVASDGDDAAAAATTAPRGSAAARRAAPPRPTANPTDEAAPEPAPLRFNFDNEVVEGEKKGPSDEWIDGTPNIRHRSLIEIRRQFLPELIKTLEDF